MNNLFNRILRAAKLDATVYEEIEADKGAMGQAVTVVILSSLAAGIAFIGRAGLSMVFILVVNALFSWVIWAFLIYFIGAKLLPELQTRTSTTELLRTVGFASSPGIIRVFGIIPGFSDIVSISARVWMLMAMIIAVKHALDYKSMWRAVIVCLIGMLVQIAIGVIMLLVLPPTAAGP